MKDIVGRGSSKHLGTARQWLASCLLLLCGTLAASAQTAPASAPLRIAAAADLEPVLPAVLERFAARTGVQATATYQSSATLAQQIINGAPFDIFFAADTSFPQQVISAGLATETAPVVYARGTLVLWARRDAAVVQGKPLSLETLRDPQLSSVAIANPEHAPYGRAARAALSSLGLDRMLAPKLRVAANIAQAAQYADSGNADVGFLSLTSARTEKLGADGTSIPVPENDYPPILQGAVVLKNSPDQADAQRLLDFIAQPETRALLEQKGLRAPQ